MRQKKYRWALKGIIQRGTLIGTPRDNSKGHLKGQEVLKRELKRESSRDTVQDRELKRESSREKTQARVRVRRKMYKCALKGIIQRGT